MFDYIKYQEKLKTHPLFRSWWVFWSNYSAVPISLITVLLFFYYAKQQKVYFFYLIALIVAAVLIRFGLIKLINYIKPRRRPYQVHNFQPITTGFFSAYSTQPDSFPSRHLAVLTVIFVGLIYFLPHTSLLTAGSATLLICLLLTGAGRVILGYHYISDVIVGFFLSLICAPIILAILTSIMQSSLPK